MEMKFVWFYLLDSCWLINPYTHVQIWQRLIEIECGFCKCFEWFYLDASFGREIIALRAVMGIEREKEKKKYIKTKSYLDSLLKNNTKKMKINIFGVRLGWILIGNNKFSSVYWFDMQWSRKFFELYIGWTILTYGRWWLSSIGSYFQSVLCSQPNLPTHEKWQLLTTHITWWINFSQKKFFCVGFMLKLIWENWTADSYQCIIMDTCFMPEFFFRLFSFFHFSFHFFCFSNFISLTRIRIFWVDCVL